MLRKKFHPPCFFLFVRLFVCLFLSKNSTHPVYSGLESSNYGGGSNYMKCRLTKKNFQLNLSETAKYSLDKYIFINPIQMGLFGASHGYGVGGVQKDSLPKFGHTYIKNWHSYTSHDTPIKFCLHQHFFTGNQ